MRTNTLGAASAGAADSRFSRSLTPGRTDGFGERFSTLDADGSPLELLRFRDELAAAPGFDSALRDRVAALSGFRHAAFPRVSEIIEDGGRLTLVTAPVVGQRVSEFTSGPLALALRPAFVTHLVREVIAALAALEASGAHATHGALTADRIFIAKDGAVSLSEYVFGPALEQLALWPEELWLQFGLLAPADDAGHAVFDARTSLMQLGATSVGLLLGRQVSLQDFEHRLPALLDEATALASTTSSALVVPLRRWVERALQLTPEGYETAEQAGRDLQRLLDAAGPAALTELARAEFPPTSKRSRHSSGPQNVPTIGVSDAGIASAAASERTPRPRLLVWVAVALGVVAAGEAIAIAQLLLRAPRVVTVEPAVTIESPQAGDTVVVDGKTVGATPFQLTVGPNVKAIRLIPAQTGTAAAAPVDAAPPRDTNTDRVAAALAQAAARQRSGGIAFSSPIELKVLEGQRVLGSTVDGPIVATAGTHQLDLVNTALGFRTRQSVTIRAGVITPLTITPPMGRISINAQPWARVSIDETLVGETPLANVPVALGEHEIVFRHPQLGERRERVTVRADAPARISTSFQRP